MEQPKADQRGGRSFFMKSRGVLWFTLVLVLFFCTDPPGPHAAQDTEAHFVAARRAMVEEQLKARDISDPLVLAVM
jgi:hypothetical protein